MYRPRIKMGPHDFDDAVEVRLDDPELAEQFLADDRCRPYVTHGYIWLAPLRLLSTTDIDALWDRSVGTGGLSGAYSDYLSSSRRTRKLDFESWKSKNRRGGLVSIGLDPKSKGKKYLPIDSDPVWRIIKNYVIDRGLEPSKWDLLVDRLEQMHRRFSDSRRCFVETVGEIAYLILNNAKQFSEESFVTEDVRDAPFGIFDTLVGVKKVALGAGEIALSFKYRDVELPDLQSPVDIYIGGKGYHVKERRHQNVSMRMGIHPTALLNHPSMRFCERFPKSSKVGMGHVNQKNLVAEANYLWKGDDPEELERNLELLHADGRKSLGDAAGIISCDLWKKQFSFHPPESLYVCNSKSYRVCLGTNSRTLSSNMIRSTTNGSNSGKN